MEKKVLMPAEPPAELVAYSNDAAGFDEVLFDLRGDMAGLYREFVKRYGQATTALTIIGDSMEPGK